MLLIVSDPGETKKPLWPSLTMELGELRSLSIILTYKEEDEFYKTTEAGGWMSPDTPCSWSCSPQTRRGGGQCRRPATQVAGGVSPFT